MKLCSFLALWIKNNEKVQTRNLYEADFSGSFLLQIKFNLQAGCDYYVFWGFAHLIYAKLKRKQ
jgi:hypothetical protein